MEFKKIFLALIFTILAFFGSAQSNGTVITGITEDSRSKAVLEFATIQLLNSADSSVIKSTVTDKKGRFSISNVQTGNYVLLCTFIGYEKVKIPVSVANQQRINLGNIIISSLSQNMDEVLVTSKKSLINSSIDRKIYNVAQDIMANSGSASDILKNIPSVEVDIDGNVSLRGSDGVMILINGKPSPLMGSTKAEVLQQLPANSIERIEVITNPSARFKPDGTSGIINIVLKKNIKIGLNGTVSGTIGNNDRYGGNVNLGYKQDKLTAFGVYGVRKDYRIRINNITRQSLDAAGITGYYQEHNQSFFRPLSNFATLGFEYTLNNRNSIGISGNYSNRKFVRNDVINKSFYNNNHVLTNKYDRLRYEPETDHEKDATIFWQHNFLKEDHELRFELNISKEDEVEDNRYTNVYYMPLLRSSFDNTLISRSDRQKQVTLDYSNPISDDSKFEAGYDGSFSKLDPTFSSEYFDTAQKKFVKDISRSNTFLYDEAVHAFYVTYQRNYEVFGYSAGLRAEQTYIKGNLVTKDSLIDNSYFKIYPTLHFGYKLKKGEIQLNYSRRVNRPDEDDLNPFPEYRDPQNLQAGNPKLLPEIIHSVEFGYKWQDDNFSFVPSVYYRYKKNGFTWITIPLNDSTLLTTQQNLSNDQAAGLELIFSARSGTFFSSNVSANLFYNTIDGTDLGFTGKKSIYSMSANFNSTFTITKNTMVQVSSNYRSARLTPQGKSYGTFVFNTGVRQDLFKKKLTVTLTASDLFKTLKEKRELHTSFLTQTAVGIRDARTIYLGIAWHFGRAIKKPAEEKLQFDDSL